MGKPFIKLLRTPINYYFYEVGRNEIIKVDDNIYSYLSMLINDLPVVANDDVMTAINILKEAGYLSEQKMESIRHPSSSNLKLLLDRKLESMLLQLTQDCNFRCAYCIYSEVNNTKQRAHSKKDMSWDTAKKAVDFFLEHSVDAHRRNIGFYGGEPLLKINLLKQIIEYAEKRLSGRKLTFSLTTNGSLLTNDIVEYLCEHNVVITVSIDGPKEIHDKNRVFKNGDGTYDVVMERLHNFKMTNPQNYDKLIINMVVDPNNDIDCINSVTVDLEDLESSNLMARYVESTDIKITISPEFSIKSSYHGFLAYLSYLGRFPKNLLSPIGQAYYGELLSGIKFFSPTIRMPKESSPSGPCIPGHTRLFVTVDERLFPCERVNETDIMCIGNLEHGFDYEKSNTLLNIATITADECKECWAQHHCTLCSRTADSGDKFSREMRLSHCAQIQNATEKKLRSLILIKEISEFYNNQVSLEVIND